MASPDDRRLRADQLFDAALDLEGKARAAYLDRACDGDAELRRLVERLIASAEIEETEILPGGGMQGPLWDGLVEAIESVRDDEDATPAGTVIGRYRIVRELGRGGMAVVYSAERADGQFEQQVALKRIRSGIGTEQVIRRFDQERQILALARHPNIAQLLDGGLGPDGRPYFVMEYVEGRPIDRYCDEERLSVTERLELFLQVARAVGYAHRNLVVHRDIKPSNILVSADGHVKLLDFGIAKLLDAGAAPGEVPVTRSFDRLMTPIYASPEQLRGRAVTTASDIYQLGLLLYQLLTGRWPYDLSDQQPVAVARAICEAEPTRPSSALDTAGTAPAQEERPTPEAISAARRTSPARLGRQLAGDLDRIVLTALRKEPERRYGAVEQLIDDLERFLAGKPVSARPDTFAYRASKLVRRHKAVFLTAAAAALLLAVLAVFYTFQLTRETERARLAAAEAGQVSDFLRSLFEISAPTRSKGEQVTARELLDRGAVRIEQELAGQGPLQAALMTLMGNVYRELAHYEEARPLLERAVALRREQEADPLELAESVFGLARLREDEGEYGAARALYEEALALRERALGGADPEVAHALCGLGRVLARQAAYEQARRLHQRAVEILEAAHGPDHPDVGRALADLGQVLQSTRELEQARALYERALAIFEAGYDGDHPWVADTRVSLASVLRLTGDAAAARAAYQRALPQMERIYGPDHPSVAAVLDQLGRLLNAESEYETAIAHHQRALAIRRAALGLDHPQVAASLNNLGLTYFKKQDLATARRYFERSLEVMEAAYGPDHVDVAKPLVSLAGILRQTGELEKAAALFERVVAIRERALGPDHSLLTRPLTSLGRLLLQMGDAAAAEALLRRALALGRGHEPHRHPEVIWPRIHLARSLTALEAYGEAEALLLENLGEESLDRMARRWTRESLEALYQAWGRPLDAERQRREIAALDAESAAAPSGP